MVEIKGLGLGFAAVAAEMPATTGSIKYGPKRFSYSVELTRCVNVSGVISRSSFIRYMLTRNRNCSFLLVSVPTAHAQCVHVRCQSRETVEQSVVDGKHLLKVHSNARRLRTKAQVARNRNTVLANHRYDGAAVIFHNRLLLAVD